MFNVEVLSKFPVVQHFPFGALFAWEADPSAKRIQASVHTSSQPKPSSVDHSSTVPSSTSSTSAYSSPRPQPQGQGVSASLSTTRVQPPLRDPMTGGMPSTSAPWATSAAPPSARAQPPLRDPMTDGMPSTAAPWATLTSRPAAGQSIPSGLNQPTRAPWMTRTPAPPPPGGGGTSAPWVKGGGASGAEANEQAGTKAPWADKRT
jgi:serine/threonine-protein phosphatase 2A activator